jgi:hypothetical protein
VGIAEPDEPADWSDLDVDWPVRMAEHMGPSGEALNLLAGVNPAALSDSARACALALLTAIGAHHASVVASFTVAVAGPVPADSREDWGVHDVAVATRMSLYAADRQVGLARDLAGRLRATHEAMSEGRVTGAQALALGEGVAHLEDEIALQIEERMLRFAHRQDLTKFRASLQRWLARLDPNFQKRSRNARSEVIAEHSSHRDGVGELFVRGPLEKTALVDQALNAYATASKCALGGTVASRKLAALVQWAENYLTSPEAPRRHGRAYGVNVIFDAPTMLGVAQHPAEIPGYGMVPAEAALELLANGSPLRRLIIDETDGHLLDYGTKTYLVPPPLADHLIALHMTSAGPHTNVPAAACDMEHNLPHDQGGRTDPDNNTPMDRRWHRAKTHADWTYVKNEDRSVTWTSPTGLTEIVYPHDYRLGP